MPQAPLRHTLSALRDHLLAPPSCFDCGFAPTRADGFRIWTWDAAEPLEVGPADHRGAYFYVRLRGPLRYRPAPTTTACSTEVSTARLPLRLVALAPCADPFALERWLRQRLATFPDAAALLISAEIDPLRAFRLERGSEAPLPEAFYTGRWTIVALDFDLDLFNEPLVCPPILPCGS